MRIVKRYSNRKLYDTTSSKYVTLEDLLKIIKGGEDVRVIDNTNDRDLTSITLAQIIFEEEKRNPALGVAGLVGIIRNGIPAAT